MFPGLTRLESATFTGEYPVAHIDFEDRSLPVKVALDAFSPFIPHEPDESGLPVAVLRYNVTNPGHTAASVSIAFSIENPIITKEENDAARLKSDQGRRNEYREDGDLAGLVLSNTALANDHPMKGDFVLAATSGNLLESFTLGRLAGRAMVECAAAFLGSVRKGR